MPFKLQNIFLLFLFLYSTSVISQRASSKTASSVYFVIPSYNIDKTNPNTFKYSFAMGKTSFKKPKSFETDEVCVSAGSNNVLKDAKKIKVYQYSVEAEIKDAFLIIETPKGEIISAEKFRGYKNTNSLMNETVELFYGDGKCYWSTKVLEMAWKEDQDVWKKEKQKNIKAFIFEKAQRSANSKFNFGYQSYSLPVYTGKGGKGNDYSSLDNAQKQALAVYNQIASEGTITQKAIDQLMVPVTTWLQTMDEVNLDDKKAKINAKVARGLYINLASAYFHMNDLDNSLKYIELHGETYKNATIKVTDSDINNLSRLISEQQKGIAENPNLSNDFEALNLKYKGMGTANIQIKDVGEDMASELAAREHLYAKDNKKQADIAANGGSIYKTNIKQGQYGSTLVMMSIYDGDLNTFPLEVTQLDVDGLVFSGGYSFTSIPVEIGNMTNLKEINLSSSAVSSIPEEIGNLTNLKKLNLSWTKISTLPESIKNLKNLKVLNIKKTRISPAELEKIQSWLPKGCKVKA
ncbi:leucine-rich repeat domain-containing protein [Lacinutrix sp. MEBiC02404]